MLAQVEQLAVQARNALSTRVLWVEKVSRKAARRCVQVWSLDEVLRCDCAVAVAFVVHVELKLPDLTRLEVQSHRV